MEQVFPIDLRGPHDNMVNIGGQNKGHSSAINPQGYYPVPYSSNTDSNIRMTETPHLVVNINTTNNFGAVPEDPPTAMDHQVAELLDRVNLPLHLTKSSASLGRPNNLNRQQLDEEEYGRNIRPSQGPNGNKGLFDL